MNRRQLLSLGATIPVIGKIDVWHDDGPFAWLPNATAGLPEGLTSDFGIAHLLPLPSLGPFLRWAWLDYVPNQQLPVVRAMAWCSDRDMYDPGRMRVGIDMGEGYTDYDVTHLLEEDDYFDDQFVRQEALTRVISVIIREHHGYATAYTS